MPKSLSFLRFEDWLARKESAARDWMVVARFQRDGATDLFTFSALASAAEGNLEKVMATHEWEIGLDTFARPFHYTGDSDGSPYYGPSLRTEVGSIEFFPFVIDRDFQGYRPRSVELVQHFILYYNAFFIAEKQEYHCIDVSGKVQPVARLRQEQNSLIVWVDAHRLKDYLTAIRCFLVRYHDHDRRVRESESGRLVAETESEILHDESSHFLLTLATGRDQEIRSRLHGKDIVLPYRNADAEEEERFIHFVIGRDEQGKEIEVTCDESELSPGGFLIPVFFQRKVLDKYYQEPSRYKVSDTDVRCLYLWYIPISATEEDLVQVWLGDLGRIPYEDQLHWRQWNVPPRGTIPERRIRSDLLAEFVSIDEPISNFQAAYERVQEAAQAMFHAYLFLPLNEKDSHAYETLHVPLSEEEKELDEQVQALAKVTVDSLNVDLLSRASGKHIDGNEIKGSIALFGAYLITKGLPEEQLASILRAFYAVQSIRSTGSAHRKGANYTKALKQFGLDGIPNSAKAKKLLADLTQALEIIAAVMRGEES